MSKPVYVWTVELSGGGTGQVRSSTQRGAFAAARKSYYLKGYGMPVKVTRSAGGALSSAQKSKTGWRWEGTRKNPTKAQKREKTRKASAKRRVAVALASYLKKVNPAVKLAGARVEKLKGGVLKITPIKANRARCNR